MEKQLAEKCLLEIGSNGPIRSDDVHLLHLHFTHLVQPLDGNAWVFCSVLHEHKLTAWLQGLFQTLAHLSGERELVVRIHDESQVNLIVG